ncbi:hypothetical protein AGMMS49938_17300 [Fibrobacterales bacterium]|nr:hypothetical protein AGMMS49938_17300 [Fibrobacterales bacterium]
MNVFTQAYRTTCIPQAGRINAVVPNEYNGHKIEIIMLPIVEEEPKYNAETLAAMQETLNIIDGKVKAKSYATVEEMHADILSEEDELMLSRTGSHSDLFE